MRSPSSPRLNAASLLGLALAIGIAAACDDTSTATTSPTGSSANFVGSYALATVNGLPLQFIDSYSFTDNSISFNVINTINSASLLVNADNTFRTIVVHRFKMSSSVFAMDTAMTDTTNGTWSQSGTAITITFTKLPALTPQTLTGSWIPPTFAITISDTLQTSLGAVGHVAPYVYRFTK